MAQYILLNEDIIERDHVVIDIEDRGYQFGDGVYEVVRIYDDMSYTLEEHLTRLIRSAQEIGLHLPYTVDALAQLCQTLCVKNNLQNGIIYLQVSRGVAPRNHAFPEASVKPLLVGYTKALTSPVKNMEQGVKAIVLEDIRWLRCDIKSLNLLGNVMAKQKAAEQGAFEAIQHRDSRVTEGSASNIFIVHQGVLITHPANNLILNGITRQRVLSIAADLNLPYTETIFTVDQLMQADEVFLTSTTNEITPIVEIDGAKIGPGSPGPITQKLQKAFTQDIISSSQKLVK